jgi:hypothetical protein
MAVLDRDTAARIERCVTAGLVGLVQLLAEQDANRPEWAWALVGRRRVPWMAAIMIGTFTVIGGLCISLWYLLKIRPAVRAAEAGDLTGLV